MALPDRFVERIAEIVPAGHFDSVVESFAEDKRTGFRANPLIGDVRDTLNQLRDLSFPVERVDWFDQAFTVDAQYRQALMESSLYLENRIYIQNLSSMVPPLALEVSKDDLVLDLTAAPGSKTLQLATLTKTPNQVAAVEVVKKRFYKLKDNLKTHGAAQVRTYLQDGTRVWQYRPDHFDKVLLDAPCSSEGRFQTDDPTTTRYWSEKKITEMARKQHRLMYSAIRSLRPGGTLVYSTCSFAPEENEAIVQRALDEFKNAIRLAPLPVRLDSFSSAVTQWNGAVFDDSMRFCQRILPDRDMDGFFIARIEKRNPSDA